ncbi:YfjI family protein [uncultured Ruegeria sp.]|uniref:YfjI family protein n=1 Tax=uncultured Ruegeria sp. TaxID=259304 RepID=UPI002624A14A|nr:YfjI family protein [uncultured Ruegeria sp.]
MKDQQNPNIVAFDPSSQWPEPDMNFGQPCRPLAPVMTESEFSSVFGPWSGWVKTSAEVKNVPTDYVAMTLLGVASAAIGNSRWAVPWDGWKEPPVLWSMLVGDPSAGKSPALDSVLDPVKEIERSLAEEYRRARCEWEAENELASFSLAQWKADAKAAVSEGAEPPLKPKEADAGNPPVRERISITDITTEKVADLLSSTWRGLLLARDELSGWLSSMDRYNGGGDRPFWLEAYGGRSYTIDRKNNPEPITVDHLSVAIVGGTQPDRLADLLVKADDDGLLARFMVVFPDSVPITRPTAVPDDARMISAISRLRSLPHATDEDGGKRPFFVHFSEPAADTLQAFREQCRGWEASASGLFKSHIGKMPGLVVRVANVLAHLDWATTDGLSYPSVIDETHVGRACHYVGEYLRHHAYRAYGAAKVPPEVEGAQSIASVIRSEGLKSFKARDIYNRRRTGLTKSQQVKAALAVLIEADWLREVRAATGGSPSVDYAVNPKLEARK